MSKIKKIVAAAVFMVAGLFGFTRPVSAGDCPDGSYRGTFEHSIAECQMDPDQTTTNTNLFGMIRDVINIILSVLGVIAVFMVIMGGINYMTSQGDPGKTKKGRDSILYGIIGLIIALLAYSIVNFVLANVFVDSGSGSTSNGNSSNSSTNNSGTNNSNTNNSNTNKNGSNTNSSSTNKSNSNSSGSATK